MNSTLFDNSPVFPHKVGRMLLYYRIQVSLIGIRFRVTACTKCENHTKNRYLNNMLQTMNVC